MIEIVTLNYNQSIFLTESVRSIQQQEMRNWRLTIVDPGSTDGAELIYNLPLLANDSRITILRGPDKGPADGLNKGFSTHGSSESIMYYLNADDRVLPGAFEQAVKFLDRHSDVDIITGNGYTIDAFGRRLGKIYSDEFDPDMYVRGKCVAVQQATFFRRSVYEANSGFNVLNNVSWDGEFLFRASTRGATIRASRNYWGEFRVYAGTITSDTKTQDIANRLLEDLGAEQVPISQACFAYRTLRRRLRHPGRTVSLAMARAQTLAGLTQLGGQR